MSNDADDRVDGLPLDGDEFEHANLIPESALVNLELVKEGAILTLNMVQEVSPNHPVGSPEFMTLRSLAKTANLHRYAVVGLQLGYYGGAASVIRAAYESLLYAFLFSQQPKEVIAWVRLGLDSKLGKTQAKDEEKRLLGAARDAFNQETDEQYLGYTIWQSASDIIHHGLEGIAAECGLDPRELIPKDLAKALEAADQDFELAMGLLEMQAKFVSTPTRLHSSDFAKGLPWTGDVGSLIDEDQLDYWSTLLLYLSHRTTDFIYDRFTSSRDTLKHSYGDWHKTVKNL